MKKTTSVVIALVLVTATGITSIHIVEARGAQEYRTRVDNAIPTAVQTLASSAVPSRTRGRVATRTSAILRQTAEHAQPTNSPPAEMQTTNPRVVTTVETPTIREVQTPETQVVAVAPTNPTVETLVVSTEVSNQSDSSYLADIASEIHRLTNVERAKAGLATLATDSALARIAQSHSQDMASTNYFSHTAPSGCTLSCRIKGAGYEARAWGENIAWISNSNLPNAATLAEEFVTNWMNSPGHRENILRSSFTHEGIGMARVGNRVYATANFSKPR